MIRGLVESAAGTALVVVFFFNSSCDAYSNDSRGRNAVQKADKCAAPGINADTFANAVPAQCVLSAAGCAIRTC